MLKDSGMVLKKWTEFHGMEFFATFLSFLSGFITKTVKNIMVQTVRSQQVKNEF